MRELLEREKKKGKEGSEEGTNLLGALARHARECEELGEVGLSDDEIIGNTFIFLIAGHETRLSPKENPTFPNFPLLSPRPLALRYLSLSFAP